MIGIQKKSSTNKKDVQYMESGIQVVKFRIQQCLDSLTWGKGIVPVPHTKNKLCKEEIEEKNQLI